MACPRILGLASIISTSIATFHELLIANNQPLPSFEADNHWSLSEELEEARNAVIDAATELRDLLLEPADLLRMYARHANIASLHAIQRFKIAASFEPGDRVSFADLASRCGQPEANVRRMLRHAITMRIFQEPEKGLVAHTAASRLLRDEHMHDWLGATCEDSGPAALRAVDAMCKWPGSQEPNHSGMALANNTTDNMYQIFAKSPHRAARFSSAMAAWVSGKGFEMHHLLDNYDWASLRDDLVVDVGGAGGHISISIAQRYPSLNFVVQDLKDVVQRGASALPQELKSRIKFMAHDFFTDQPVTAQLYYFRWIFHNWSDGYCIRILRGLIPALRYGVKVLIHDICMPEPKVVPRWKEQLLGSMDIGMLGMLNARERYADEWQNLLLQADARFKLLGIKTIPGSHLALIEVDWQA